MSENHFQAHMFAIFHPFGRLALARRNVEEQEAVHESALPANHKRCGCHPIGLVDQRRGQDPQPCLGGHDRLLVQLPLSSIVQATSTNTRADPGVASWPRQWPPEAIRSRRRTSHGAISTCSTKPTSWADCPKTTNSESPPLSLLPRLKPCRRPKPRQSPSRGPWPVRCQQQA
jgi:hypothetical protein